MKHMSIWIAAACLFTTATAALAKSLTVAVPTTSISVRSGPRGDLYAVRIAVPEGVVGKQLDTVVIEFALDISSISEEDSLATPVVGVYPLTREFSDAVLRQGTVEPMDPTSYQGEVSSARPVVIGQNRVIRMDITRIVRGWIAEPSSNHGLVIGSITGPVVGAVYLSDEALASGSPLRVAFFYQDRSGGRVSTR
ncbi:MAG TPA: hypothetical protein VF247_07525 [Candidatus Krumholzibacteria bacterium]